LTTYTFKKISGRHQLKTLSLPSNHVINLLLENRHTKYSPSHYLSLKNITTKQQLKIKSSIIDANNHLNGIFPVFDTLYYKLSPSLRLIDNFPNCFSFHLANCRDKKSKEAHLCKLDKIFKNALTDPNTIIVISNANIKNHIVTLILHIHSNLNDIKKTIHHTINITLTIIYAIRYQINHTVQISEVSHIIVITDSIYLAKHISNSMTHSYQI